MPLIAETPLTDRHFSAGERTPGGAGSAGKLSARPGGAAPRGDGRARPRPAPGPPPARLCRRSGAGSALGSRRSDVSAARREAVVPPRHSLVPVRGRLRGDGERQKGSGGLQRGRALGVDPQGCAAASGAAPSRSLRLLLHQLCPRLCCPSPRGSGVECPPRGSGSGAAPPGLRLRGLPYPLYWQLQRACSELEGNNCYLIPGNSFPVSP